MILDINGVAAKRNKIGMMQIAYDMYASIMRGLTIEAATPPVIPALAWAASAANKVAESALLDRAAVVIFATACIWIIRAGSAVMPADMVIGSRTADIIDCAAAVSGSPCEDKIAVSAGPDKASPRVLICSYIAAHVIASPR